MSFEKKRECCGKFEKRAPLLYKTCLVDHCIDGNHRECIPAITEAYDGLLSEDMYENVPKEYVKNDEYVNPLKYQLERMRERGDDP